MPLRFLPSSSLGLTLLLTALVPSIQAADWTGNSSDWDGVSAWSPGPLPDAPSAFADFSTVDYLTTNVVRLNGNRTLGSMKFGDPAAAAQTTLLQAGSAPSTLTLDNAGAGALIDTIVSTNPPPSGFNQPPNPDAVIRVPVVLQDDLTISINTGPFPGGGEPWFGVQFSEPITEVGGPRSLTIDGNGNGMIALSKLSHFSGGVTVNAGSLGIGTQGDLGPGNATVNTSGQIAWYGNRTIPNDMTISGNGFVEKDGQRGAVFFAGADQIVTGTITLAGNSRIEGDRSTTVQFDGPLVGSSNLELNALVGGVFPEERKGAFRLNGDASGLTGAISVSRGSLHLASGSNPGGDIKVSKLASLSGEASIGGDLILGTPAPGAGISAELTIDPVTSAALHAAGDLDVDGPTIVRLSSTPPATCTVATYGGSLTGNPADLDLLGGLASYRAGTGFDTVGTPGSILLNVVRDSLVWNAGTAPWDTTGTTWVGGDTFHFLDDVTFDNTNVGGGVITISGDLQVGTIHVNNSAGNDYTLHADYGSTSSPLFNSIAAGGIVKDGTGTLTIGTVNGTLFNRHTFPDGTVINEGRVRVLQNGDGSLSYGPLGTGTITMNGGALSGQSNLPLSLYNKTILNGNVALGESGQTNSFSLRNVIELGASLTLDIASEVGLGIGPGPLTGVTDGGAGHSLTKIGSGLLVLNNATTNEWGGTTTIGAGIFQVMGDLTCGNVTIQSGATLAGTGKLTASVTLDAGSTLAPGTFNSSIDSASITLIGDLAIAGTYQCELENFSRDHLEVSGALDITSATLDIDLPSGAATKPSYVIATYTTLVGSAFANIQDLPAGYGLDYAYDDGNGANHIAVVLLPTPYEIWAAARGLTEGVNDDHFDDPNSDNTPNIVHFACDTDPLGSGESSGRGRIAMVPPSGGDEFLTLTIPIRSGAVFTGNPLQATIDGITYTASGSLTLQDLWNAPVLEVVPALDSGLPARGDYDGSPGADWSYRTFRLSSPVSVEKHGFLRIGVNP